MKAKELSITFPRQLNDHQEKTLIGHFQSIRQMFKDGLQDLRRKSDNPTVKLLLRASPLSASALNGAVDSMLAPADDGKPVFYKLFVLESADKKVYRFTYMDVSQFAGYLPYFGGSAHNLTEKKAERTIKKFIVSTAHDMGFTERSIKIEKVEHAPPSTD